MKKSLKDLKKNGFEKLLDDLLVKFSDAMVHMVEGFDKSVVDVEIREDKSISLIYCESSVIGKLREENNWSEEEAYEWFHLNIEPISGLDNGPIFISSKKNTGE